MTTPINSPALIELSLAITKATSDGNWQAVASDTLPDKTGESTSIALFKDWIRRAETGETVSWLPPPRNPFLGISHYPSFEGYGEAGQTVKMWIDGNRFKVSGKFNLDNPVGKALFDTIRRERELTAKGETVANPVRISAAWWDIAHSHGSFIFERKSLADVCPVCVKGGNGQKTYLMGQADHWAGTRVPINPRTNLALEEKSMAITRKDDAASMIDEELAEELDTKAKLTGKSETTLIVKAKPKADEEDDEKTEDKPDEDDAKEEDEEKEYNFSKKKKAGPFQAVANGEEFGYQPLGGAVTLDDADDYIQQGKLLDQAYSNYDVYRMVVDNIFQYGGSNTIPLIQQATADFNERIATIKAAVVDAWLIDPAVVSPTKGDYSDMSADIFDATRDAVNEALTGAQSRQQAVEAITKAFTQMAGTIEGQVNMRYPQAQGEVVAQAVKAAIEPLMQEIGLMKAKLGQVQQPVLPVPQQKSFVPGQMLQEQPIVSPVTGKPSQLTEMIRRSVGIVS